MTQQTKNVVAASPKEATGGVLWAPPGTPLPTDSTTALDGDFIPFGYVGEEGVQPSGDSASWTDIPAWGADVVARLLESESSTRYTFKLIEVLNGDVANFVFGEDNVTVTPATLTDGTKLAIEDKATEPPDGILCFEMFYKGKTLRIILPNAQSQVLSEDPLVHTAISAYEIETTALKDASGNRRYIYAENDDLLTA